MAKLYILTGLPFSGKTTLSKKIAKYTNSERISFDELWIELESKKDLENRKKLSWSFVRSEINKDISNFLKHNKSVVYDDMNARKEHRDSLKVLAENNGADFQVVFIDISKDLAIERRKLNFKSKDRHDVSDKNFNSALKQFEKPGQNEKAIVFNSDNNVDEWLEKNFQIG